ncbi:MAG: efflux RND transporter periplasmic adaptor subunit [Bacteroidia bacterium]
MKRILMIAGLLGVAALMIWTGVYLYNKDKEVPIVYRTERPIYTDIVQKAVATGAVVPRKEIEIKPQVSGLVDKLYVEPGDRVNKGDLIATIQIVPNMASLANAENRLRIAEINLQNAERDFNRNKPLFQEGVISAAAFQQFELTFETAKQELEAARDNLEIIRKGATQRSGRIANTNVRATISGMVLDVPVEEGNSVIEANTFNAGTTLAIIANMEEMIFEGKVDESEVGKIREGMNLLLTIGAIDQERFEAELEHISPKGVEENGAIQFGIRAAVRLKAGQFIRAGYSANADIVLAQRDSVLAVREGLLIFEGDKTYVEIARGNQRFEKVPIETGLSDGIHIEVLSGVASDDELKDPIVPQEPE